MKFGYLLFLGMIIGLSSCQWGTPNNPKPDITTDTLTYTYKTIKERAADCGNKPDSECTVALIKYPVFNDQPKLNDSVSQKLMLSGLDNPDKKRDTSLQAYAGNFIKGYLKDNPKQYSPDMFYTLNFKALITRQDSSLINLQIDGYTYQGGAHGASFTYFINWNTKKQISICLKDIFVDGSNDKLTQIADTIFRHNEKISMTASIKDNYHFWNAKFELNNNFLITPLGIKFLYNQYEIKPYAAGQTELFIPYSKIKSLLQPNTVITQYLK